MRLRLVINHGQKRWRLDLGQRDGKRRVRFFVTKKEAEKAFAQAQADSDAIGRQ